MKKNLEGSRSSGVFCFAFVLNVFHSRISQNKNYAWCSHINYLFFFSLLSTLILHIPQHAYLQKHYKMKYLKP
jgi:hypothetical protein